MRLIFRDRPQEYWGIQETNWEDAPVLGEQNCHPPITAARLRPLLLDGPKPPHGRAARAADASYWVVNTLLDSLSNETMIAIAKGLQAARSQEAEQR